MITVTSKRGATWVVCRVCGKRGPAVTPTQHRRPILTATAKIRALESGWKIVKGKGEQFPVLVCPKCQEGTE